MSTANFLKGECSHCAGHIEFPASAAGEVVACPHCGRQTELMATVAKSKPAVPLKIPTVTAIVIFITVAVLALAAIFFNKHSPAVVVKKTIVSTTPVVTTAIPDDKINTNEFAIASFKLEHTTGSSLVYVTGKLQNLASRQRFGIKLVFELFDTNNIPIGKASDYHQMIEPHADWMFKALVLDSKAASARFNSIREDQ